MPKSAWITSKANSAAWTRIVPNRFRKPTRRIISKEASEYPVSNIPEPLKALNQWVGWQNVIKDDRPTKIPVNVHTGRTTSSFDSRTWSSFDDAFAYFADHRELAGLGFVFTQDDPFAGVDLDDCLNDEGGLVWGKDVVDGLKTYTEVSPSWRGVKLFVQADKPNCTKYRKDGFGQVMLGKLEVYDHGCFFAVTGRRIDA